MIKKRLSYDKLERMVHERTAQLYAERKRLENILEAQVQERTAELAQLNAELKKSNEKFRFLSETAFLLFSAEAPEKIVETICKKAMKFLDCHVFFNFLADKKDILILNAYEGIPKGEAKKIGRLEFGVAICRHVARKGKRIVAENIQQAKDKMASFVRSYGVRAYACYPLFSSGKVIGIISFGTRSRGRFSADELDFIQAVAHQVSVVIERRKIESALRQSESRYRSYVELTDQFAWFTNAKGEVEEDLPALRKFTGQSFEEIKRDSWAKALHPDDFKRTLLVWKKAVATKSKYEIEYRMRRADGQYRHMLVRGVPILKKDGTILEWVGTCVDITERKKIEAEIEKISRFPAETPLPVLRVSRDLRILYANEASKPILKYWKYKMRKSAPEDFDRKIREVFDSGDKKEFEIEIKGKIFLFTVVPIKKDGYVNLYGRDISELKKVEEDLEKLNAILEKKIIERTAELTEANKQLAQEVEERKEREKVTAARNFILDLIAKKSSRKDFFNILTENLRGWSGCSNIGIRVLAEDGSIPYEAATGFSREFLDKESHLSIIRDQCACIRVITGLFEPQDLSVITDFGSFFSNDTMAFVTRLTKAQKARFRGVCVEDGYASVAVIPIRYKNKVIAAIHLADKEKNKVPLKTVEFFESLASLVGEGIKKFSLEERVRHAHFTQNIINSLLRSSLENISLEELLQDALEKILSVPWFSFERKGSIFLYDEKSGKLIIKAQKDLPEYLRNECDGLPVGKCICGQAALKKKTQFYDHISAEHEITNKKMFPHGHYCLPILSKEKLLGVINIYLREGFCRDNIKEAFLISIANALAGIIEYRNTQEELSRTTQNLNETKRLSDIGTLAATIAHELRNPLGVVRIAAYNIKRKAQNPLLESHLANIEKKILESEQIISNLLFYSRIKIPHYENTKIYEVLDECVKDVQKRHAKLKVRIVRRYRPISGLSVELDPFQIREVFMNILNNAYEAVDEKKGKIEVAASENGGDEVCISFKDNGIGIGEENLKRLSEPFFTTKTKGTGLGLTVSYQIVSLHSGRIEVQSQKGKGSLFKVCLLLKRK